MEIRTKRQLTPQLTHPHLGVIQKYFGAERDRLLFDSLLKWLFSMKVVKTVPAPRGEREAPAGEGAEGFFFFDLLFHDLRLASLVLHQTSEISANQTQGTEYHESEFKLDTLNA